MAIFENGDAPEARVPLATVLNRDGYRVRPRPRIPRKPSEDEDENEDEADGPSTVSSCPQFRRGADFALDFFLNRQTLSASNPERREK